MREHQVLRPNPLCHSAEIACHALAIKDWRRCNSHRQPLHLIGRSSELVGAQVHRCWRRRHNTSGWRVHAIGRIPAMWVDRIALKHEYLRQLVDYRLDCVGSAQLAGTRVYLMATDTQVLVVGAGPVGLFMAAELNRSGVARERTSNHEAQRPSHERLLAKVGGRARVQGCTCAPVRLSC
jgi:hypothetical protein